MAENDLERLRKQFLDTEDLHQRIALLDLEPNVQKLLSSPNFFRVFLQGLTPECECALKQCAAIGQAIDPTISSAEKWRGLLQSLLTIDRFYREIGGIIGYQAEVLKLLETSEPKPTPGAAFHSPVFEDISKEHGDVVDSIRDGLEALSHVAELYPLGGAADRLHLIDAKTGIELPAAKLQFAGHTLLETLIRDLQAREWLYFRLFGRQLNTPIAIMTSREKDNHEHVLKICEDHEWFGRPKELFRLFNQPLVPTVDERGNWHTTGPLRLYLKPGGHGAIWKLARDEGVFDWLKSLGYKKALVRQINNPIAGLDYGLIAFTGIGYKRNMSFGFASCCRVVKSAEGMIVLVEKGDGRIALTNIEYCDFAKFGIEDKPLDPGKPYEEIAKLQFGAKSALLSPDSDSPQLAYGQPDVSTCGEREPTPKSSNLAREASFAIPSYSRFTSNTNILFVDLDAVSRAVESYPFPGLLMNLRQGIVADESGSQREVSLARLESTMQNIADAFCEPKSDARPLKTEKTFATYNFRHKTISVAKKAYVPGKSLLETPERCFYDLLSANRELLTECGFTLAAEISIEEYLEKGPSTLFLYHPTLGPLYSIIRQKIRKGSLSLGSELLLEIAEVDFENIAVAGSLRIIAERVIGQKKNSILNYTTRVGRCFLQNVTVKNSGVEWGMSSPYWKMDLQRKESLLIELKGFSEFEAIDCHFEGSHHFIVEDGTKLAIRQKEGEIIQEIRPISQEPLWYYSWKNKVQIERPK